MFYNGEKLFFFPFLSQEVFQVATYLKEKIHLDISPGWFFLLSGINRQKRFPRKSIGEVQPLPIWGLFFKDEVFGTFELGVLCRQRTLAYEDRYHWNHCMMTFVFSWSGVSLITENESYWTCYTYLDVTALPSQHFSFFEGIKWEKITTTHQTCCDLTTLPLPFQKVSHLGKKKQTLTFWKKKQTHVKTCCDLILANHEKRIRIPETFRCVPTDHRWPRVKAWNSEKGFGFCSVSWLDDSESSWVGELRMLASSFWYKLEAKQLK